MTYGRVALTHAQREVLNESHLGEAREVAQDLLRELCFPSVRGAEAAKAKAREWMREVRKGGAS
mgnify:CR=1 FL=1